MINQTSTALRCPSAIDLGLDNFAKPTENPSHFLHQIPCHTTPADRHVTLEARNLKEPQYIYLRVKTTAQFQRLYPLLGRRSKRISTKKRRSNITSLSSMQNRTLIVIADTPWFAGKRKHYPATRLEKGHFNNIYSMSSKHLSKAS